MENKHLQISWSVTLEWMSCILTAHCRPRGHVPEAFIGAFIAADAVPASGCREGQDAGGPRTCRGRWNCRAGDLRHRIFTEEDDIFSRSWDYLGE